MLLFRDFWLSLVVVAFSPQGTWPQHWLGPLEKIARSSPPLVVPETLVSLDTDLSSNSVLRRRFPDEVSFGNLDCHNCGSRHLQTVNRLRSAISAAFPSSAPVLRTIGELETIYFAALTQLESMRMRTSGALEPLLKYISSVGTFSSMEPLVELLTQQVRI